MICICIFMLACALFNEENKGPILLSISTWFVLGNQNVQAKKVTSFNVISCRPIVCNRTLVEQIEFSDLAAFSQIRQFG